MHRHRLHAYRGLALLATTLLFAMSVVALPARTAQAQDATGASTYVDQELHQALVQAGLVDAWVEASGISASAVLGPADYQLGRDELLTALSRLSERRQHIDERAVLATTLNNQVDVLESLTRSLRREVSSTGRSAVVSLTPRVVADARVTLESIAGDRRWLGISLDPLVLAEHRLIGARDELGREIEGLSRNSSRGDKTFDATVARLTDIHADLQRIRTLIDATTQRSLAAEFEYAAHRSSVIATMATLHDARLLRPTSVGGLSVVTLDAYVRGADALDPSCPVDWALLAGIGRVESRHGTIDGSVVQRSGRVSIAILGPLLDGGATEREAVAAAEAAAEAEEARRLAEDAAASAEEVEPGFAASVWGEDTIERANELVESAAAGRAPVGLAAPPEPPAEQDPKPRYDPLIWGDDLPFDEDDFLPTEDEGDVDEDEEEPEFKGNGFAVIADSDNGRLDGNNRWDRAVGPMQFIPETWSYWETDGNNDGVIDPQNLYDAAATAGQFLCYLSRTRGASPYSFVLGYNSSQTYVRNVMAFADAFGANSLPLLEE